MKGITEKGVPDADKAVEAGGISERSSTMRARNGSRDLCREKRMRTQRENQCSTCMKKRMENHVIA